MDWHAVGLMLAVIYNLLLAGLLLSFGGFCWTHLDNNYDVCTTIFMSKMMFYVGLYMAIPLVPDIFVGLWSLNMFNNRDQVV